MTNLIGQTLLDQYRVDAFVASGGMGAVYCVSDLKRNVPLAMKVLHADLAEDPSIFKRFEREARALKKLAHPNIVPFYGLFKTSDFAFLLEQYIDGPTLKQVLRQQGAPLPVEEALIYLKALCAALGYAHVHGVVHCDVKPGNVMIDQGGSIYLTDFGVARHAESTTTTLGSAGTPAYMAPEQCRSEAVTAATDVYALGIMLYEMVTGMRPFQGNEAGTEHSGATAGERIRYAHLHVAPLDPRQVNPAISQALADVILKALAKELQSRYHSTRELYEAVCMAIRVDPNAVPDRATLSSAIPETPALQMRGTAAAWHVPPIAPLREFPSHPPTPAWRQRGVLMVGALVLLVMAGIAVIALSKGGAPTPTPQLLSPSVMATSAAVVSPVPPTVASSPASVVTPVALTVAPPPTVKSIPPTSISSLLRIAYVRGPVGNSDVYVANVDGSGRTCAACAACDEAEPTWSPDGTSIAYHAACGGNYNIWVVNLNTGKNVQLTDTPNMDEREPSWSPTGSQIVYRASVTGADRNADGELWIIHADGTDPRPLGNSTIRGRSPRWSPDGTKVLFMSERGGRWQIYIYAMSSGNTTRLTDCNTNCRWPCWSPDGRFVAYHSTESATGSGSATQETIWVMPADGGMPNQLTTGTHPGRPDWSWTGQIIFNSDQGIEVIATDGTGRRLVIGDNDNWAPRWSH